MLALMHEAEPHGHLLIEGQLPDVDGLAAIVGRPVKEVKAAFAELERWKVFSLTDDGVPFSRRMIRDRMKAERDKANGKKGGNPKVIGQDNGGVNPQSNPHGNKPELESIVRKDTQYPTTTEIPQDTGQPRLVSPGGVTGLGLADPISSDPDFVQVIQAFDRERVLAFGEAQARPWPHPDDGSSAKRFLEAGADIDLCRAVFRATCQQMLGEKKSPPGTLKFCERRIANALAERARPMPAGQAASTHFDPVSHLRSIGEVA
ncbi:MAG TPA: hypothetical protein VND94_00870 [Terriglobia bacterium]|nr:hypothetical protein [Terriglobia bacterium]